MKIEEAVKAIFEKLQKHNGFKEEQKIDIEIIVQKSLNYMNRKDFPEDLILVLVQQIRSTLVTTNNVKSMTVGDTKVEYSLENTDTLISSLTPQLNHFRKVGVLSVG